MAQFAQTFERLQHGGGSVALAHRHQLGTVGLELGFDLFQGYFFAKPEVMGRTERPANLTAAVQLMGEVNRPEVDLDRVRQLLDELESKEEIARLVDSAREAQSTRIFIGSENNLFSLSGSSVIAAPYREAGGKVVGVVGVIGPTRLNYARIVPMVDFTAQALSRLMK